jgi:hypothetical protein
MDYEGGQAVSKYPRFTPSVGSKPTDGFEFTCDRCCRNFPNGTKRLWVWVQVDWFRGNDEEGPVCIPCAEALCLLPRQKKAKP